MPFTPFHFGPGYLLKSFLTRNFHFLAFVVSQVLIDCETAYNIFQGNARLHTFLHTYIGSLTVMPLAFATVWALTKYFGKYFKEPFSFKVVLLSLFAGCWSHVLFDSIMHSDARPLWPFFNRNIFVDLIDVDYLHIGCVVAGMIGLVWANKKEFRLHQKKS